MIALLLVRVAERQAGESGRRIATELQRLHLVTLQGEAGQLEQTTPLTDAQRGILAALDLAPSSRSTGR